MSSTKTDEAIEMPFEIGLGVGRRNRTGPRPTHGKGYFWAIYVGMPRQSTCSSCSTLFASWQHGLPVL